jgi:hypothetical protein
LKALVIAISVVVIGSLLACGQSATQAAADRNDLDRVIPRLPNGLSIDEAEERLGEPRTQYEVEGAEDVLVYGRWDLVFRPSLYKRTRYYPANDWPGDRAVAPLDRDVRELSLGRSRVAIERDLGQTEVWQVLDLNKRERIWYGNGRWMLEFRDRRLSNKVLYR